MVKPLFILLCTFYIAPWMFGHAVGMGKMVNREFYYFYAISANSF